MVGTLIRVWPIWQPGDSFPAIVEVDRAIAWLAARQHGVVALFQLAGLGLTRQAVSKRAAAGRLHRIHSGVYAVGHVRLTRAGRYMAAVLACGLGALLSHRSAADLRGLRPGSRSVVDVTAPWRAGRSRPGIAAHSSRILTPADVTAVDGIPCTSVPRTLLDLAAVVDDAGVRRAIERAERQRLFNGREVEALLSRAGGHPGMPRLERVLASPINADETELERIAAALLASDPSIPAPERHQNIEGHECDFIWRDQRLNVEVDGGAFHDTEIARRRDRRRDRTLARADWRVVRFGWDEVVNHPSDTLAEVRGLLGRSPLGASGKHR
jgi:very-short-patch-repair endonuclease